MRARRTSDDRSGEDTSGRDHAPEDTLSSAAMRARVRVLVPLALPGPLDYALPEGMDLLPPGTFVRVPLGRREVAGVVWDGVEAGESPPSRPLAPDRLKPVLGLLETPPMAETMRRFIDWVAAYTLSAPGSVLKMAMSIPEALAPEPERPGVCLEPGWVAPPGFRMTPPRRKVLERLASGAPETLSAIRQATGVAGQVVRGLVEAGALRSVSLPPFAGSRALVNSMVASPAPPASMLLTRAQEEAASILREAVNRQDFGVFLLDGVTGSGKTETYFEAVAETLSRGRQVLVLLPEIALTPQWVDRFRKRFGFEPVLWHSALSPARRRRHWRLVAEGRARVVAGARSALFLPLADPGLIVIDEEHEPAYKQDDGVLYSARDMGIVRGQLERATVVLASATPSLETLENVRRGRYRHLALPDRVSGAVLPEITLVDLRSNPPERNRWLSPPLVSALAKTLDRGQQALLFLNRRGYAPLTLCRACGHRLACPQCSAWLVDHRREGKLRCHHCGHAEPLPVACPSCGAEDSFAACGPGVERIFEETAMRFPEARLRLLASDTVAGPQTMQNILDELESGSVDIVIGTQMMAKGHHVPGLTLVGVIDGDLGLSGGDLRAAERTHQLLVQVSGRAGRGAHAGRVLIQTHGPEHPVMAALAAGRREAFLAAEMREREQAGMPPFGRLAAIILAGPDRDALEATARALGRTRPRRPGLEVLGPAPAALSRLRGRHRLRFLVRADRDVRIQPPLRAWLAGVRPGKGVRIQVDIDPQSFL